MGSRLAGKVDIDHDKRVEFEDDTLLLGNSREDECKSESGKGGELHRDTAGSGWNCYVSGVGNWGGPECEDRGMGLDIYSTRVRIGVDGLPVPTLAGDFRGRSHHVGDTFA